MTDFATLLEDDATTVAVVGATDNQAKYGSVIYRDLKGKGFTVWPVNHHRATVDGDTAYATLGDLPEQPTIVNIVVPPDQTLLVAHQANELGFDNVWVQPGAESDEVLDYLAESGLNFLTNACIMVRSRSRSAV